MGIDFCVAPNNDNTVTAPNEVFVYAIPWGDGVAWSDGAVFRVVSEDGSETHEFAKGDGQPLGSLLLFTFSEAQPGIRYRGIIVDGEFEVEQFGAADLCAIQHPNDPCSHLPFSGVDTFEVAAGDDTAAPPDDGSDDSTETDSDADSSDSDDSEIDSSLDLDAVANAASADASPSNLIPGALR